MSRPLSCLLFFGWFQGDPQFHRVGPVAAQRLDERLVDILRLLRPFKSQSLSSESTSFHAAEYQPHQSFASLASSSFSSSASSSVVASAAHPTSSPGTATIALDERSAALLQSTLDAQRSDLARQERVLSMHNSDFT